MHAIGLPAASAPSAVQALQANADVAAVEYDASRVVEATPSDASYPQQWALPKIGWDQAFGAVQPSGISTVAILDTGIDASHPDLAGNVVPGTSVLDGSYGMTDPNGHGTWMAGIVGALTDNGVGIAGVGYANVRVMPVTVLGPDGTGQDSDIISGVVWAADHGANVILMAFSNTGYSPALQSAIDYAWSKGVVLVAATGNDSSTSPSYPAGDRGVIGVSATDSSDALASFSNSGADTFLGAPGVSISTTAAGGGYTSVSGTSASAAIVAGAAGLLRAVDPSASNGVVVQRLGESADPAGTSSDTGNGRLNLSRALSDTSTVSLEPSGAPGGGPFVGPYVAASANLTSILVGAQSGTPTYGTSGSATYQVTVNGSGSGSITVGVTGLPSSTTFAPTGRSCNASNNGCNFTLTITTAASTPAVTSQAFTVTVTGNGSGSPSGSGSLTVNPKALTITASNQSKTYGTALSLGTTAFTTSGLANSDTVTGVTLVSAGAAATAAVGTYTITPSAAVFGVGSGSNYTIAYANAPVGLIVSRKALTITASGQSKTYGTALSLGTTAFTTSGLANSDTVTAVTLTSAGAAATATVAGSPYPITPSAAVGTGLGNYTISFVDGKLTVNPAALTIAASDQSKTYGTTATLGTTGFT
ncbi:MAG TPA: S8 family serine peptidase, partial [Candidatus Limnocylindrales bacterium]